MANVIRLKRRVTGVAGAPSALKSGELALNFVDSTLYVGVGDDGSGNATSIVAYGGPGAFATLAGAQTFTGIKTFAASPIIPDASSSAQAASKGQMDSALALKAPLASPALTGTPTAPTAATADNSTQLATTAFVKAQGYLASGVSRSTLGVPTADVAWGGHKITGLADPVSAQDAATKAYVDAARQGLDAKDSVRVATTTNIALSGLLTIDGVTLVAGDRVLVKDQTTGSQNGLYVAASGAWARAGDANTAAKVTAGLFVFAEEGSTNADTGWVLSTNGAITLDTTALAFVQFSAAGTISAGNGLAKAGNVLAAVGTSNRITVSGAGIDIAATYAGQTSIVTLGTVTAGAWQATAIGLAYGGTGASLTGLADGTIVKKSGTALAAATAGTDYLDPSSTIDGGSF
jgi:hypothetical protein